jgi:hypothetical protein
VTGAGAVDLWPTARGPDDVFVHPLSLATKQQPLSQVSALPQCVCTFVSR